MKKIIGIFILCLTVALAGCTNTPDNVSIQSTVESAVSTAIAPYEARYSDFITAEELEQSQKEQNQTIQQYVVEQIDQARDSLSVGPTDIPEQAAVGSVYEYTDDRMQPTPTAYVYDNTNCVDEFTFVSDLTIPDGMTITPGTNFQKSWYVTNSGTCTWNSNYKVVYYSGDLVGTSKSFSFLQPGYYIKPGESTILYADLVAPSSLGATYSTFWAMESDTGTQFGSGPAKNVYLSSNFRVENSFVLAQNFGSLTCSDDYGYFTCGSSVSGSRGAVYYDSTPMLESGRSQGNPAIAVIPPSGDNTTVRFEFGPLRFPRGSWFYSNFCCRPETPTCDVQIRLYVREPGYGERLMQEVREWNDGLMGEWKFKLDDVGIFDQDFVYIIEVQSNGGANSDDLILFTNTRIY